MKRSAALLLSAMTCLMACPATADSPVRNVVLIGVDDLRTNLGAYGADWTQTPNMDRLSAMGVRFERAYTNISICNPSRASFLSGWYPETTTVLRNPIAPRSIPALKDMRFFPEAFQDAGYFTANIGKVEHRSHQDTMDVDEFANPQNNFPRSAIVKQGRVVDWGPWQMVDAPDNQFSDGRIAERIVQLIQEKANGDEPLFLHAGFHKPHRDWIAPKRFFDAHPPESMPLMPQGVIAGDGTRGPLEGKRQVGVLNDDDERMMISIYAAATSFMDAQIGKILSAMDEAEMWDNTLVILYSDHGFSLGEHDQWSKFNQWESTARIPFIVVAPGVKPGVSYAPVELVDLYPTLMEMCGIQPPHKLEGDSVVPLLENPDGLTDGLAYTVFGFTPGEDRARVRSIRTREYSYIQYYNGEDVMFAADDTAEAVDLTQDPAYSAIHAYLKQLLENARYATLEDVQAIPSPAGAASE